MASPGNLTICASIGIIVLIICTAIYIGRILYKERVRKDLENSGRTRNLERILELEPLPYKEKEYLESLKMNIQKDSQSQSSSSTTLLQGKEISSADTSLKKNAKKVKSRPRSFQLSKNGSPKSSSRNGSINGSRNGSRNSSIKNGSMNGSRYAPRYASRYGSRSDSNVSSTLVIKIPKENEMPPPPPPSPLKLHNGSIDSFLNIIPSDISEPTSTPIMSSNASSPLLSEKKSKSDLKAQSLIPSHGNDELV